MHGKKKWKGNSKANATTLCFTIFAVTEMIEDELWISDNHMATHIE